MDPLDKAFLVGLIKHTAVAVSVMILFTLLLFRFLIKRKSIGERIKNTLVMSWTFTMMFLFLEIVFVFIPFSQGMRRVNHSSRLWKFYYWKPINELGYRDAYLSKKDTARIKLLFIGDSFTAGAGIENTADRVSDKINSLCKNCTSFNAGKNGVDTKTEYKNLLAYPVKPDIIVLQHFVNDVDIAAANNGVSFFYQFKPLNNISAPLAFVIEKSCLINFFYWKFSREFPVTNYTDYVQKAYQTETVISEHLNDLDKIIDYAKRNSIELYVLSYPMLNIDPDNAVNSYTKKITEHLSQKTVPFVNVADLIRKEQISIDKRVVNSTDPHPSTFLNEKVAQELTVLIAASQQKNKTENKIVWP